MEIIEYLFESIEYSTADTTTRSNAYGGLIAKKGTCWAYAQSLFFICKELGMQVRLIAARESNAAWGRIVLDEAAGFDYDQATDTWNAPTMFVGGDHMAVELSLPNQKIWLDAQGCMLFTVPLD